MEAFGLFSELLLSSKETGTTTSPDITFPKDQLVTYDPSLSSYKSACQKDPELKSFNSLLCERTSKLITSVTSQEGKTGNPYLDSLMPICGFLAASSQDVVKFITDSKYDLSKHTELNSLVDLFSESTTKTLDLFNTVEKCVGKAKKSQLLIRYAIKQFEKESMDTDFGGNKKKKKKKKKKNKYAETLKELNKVIAMGDPFGDEFAKQYKDVYSEQVHVLDKIRELQVVIEKKYKKEKKWSILGNIVFGTALFSVFALTMHFSSGFLAAAKVVFGVTTPIATLWKWVGEMLHDSGLKTQIDLLLSMENSTEVNIEAMKTVKDLVESLITRISSILESVEVAVEKREEDAVKHVMQEIIQNVEEFAKQIDEIGANVAECSNSVVSGRVRVLEHRANPSVESGNYQCTIC